MKITPEMKVKIENCKSAEEIMDLAKKENFSLSNEQAQQVFDLLQSENMTDEMMKKVTGGYYCVITDKAAAAAPLFACSKDK